MQSVSSRIWTRVAVSISYDYNDYTTGTSMMITINLETPPCIYLYISVSRIRLCFYNSQHIVDCYTFLGYYTHNVWTLYFFVQQGNIKKQLNTSKESLSIQASYRGE